MSCFIYILASSNSSSITLVSSILALEPVSEPLTQMAVELINNHFSTAKEMIVKATFFFPQQTNFEMMLKCC